MWTFVTVVTSLDSCRDLRLQAGPLRDDPSLDLKDHGAHGADIGWYRVKPLMAM